MLRGHPAYRRLKVGGSGLLGAASYWLGSDHLLVVVMNGYVENYRRFLWSDIQGLVIRKNSRQLSWGLAWAGLGLLGLVGCLAVLGGRKLGSLSPERISGLVALLSLVIVCGLGVLLNWWRGPCCVCYVRTAVQTTVLPQVNRWRRAEHLAAELTPLIIAAQGGVPAPEAPAPAAPAAAPQANISPEVQL